MTTVILVIHILVSLVLVGVVLMQRSEGGALGIGGGGGGGGLMSGRGAAGALVRTTIIFGGIFFMTSLGLTVIATHTMGDGRSNLERVLDEEAGGPARDVLNDPTAPLLDDGPDDLDASAEPVDPVVPAPEESDPLSADIPATGTADEETVEDPQQ